MIFSGLSVLLRSKSPYEAITDEIYFLEFICTKIKLAYPAFLVNVDGVGRFCVLVQMHQDRAPCLTIDLSAMFNAYSLAGDETARQTIVEQFLSAIGTSVYNANAPIDPDAFVLQVRHIKEVRADRGDISFPFLGDLVCVIAQAGTEARLGGNRLAGRMRAVTHANLDALGMSYERACARTVENTAGLQARMEPGFEEDWPGLVFFRAGHVSPSGLLYLDCKGTNNLPDGAYLVGADRGASAGYVYTSARDETNMATLLMFQRHWRANAERLESNCLLIRQKGVWHIRDLIGAEPGSIAA